MPPEFSEGPPGYPTRSAAPLLEAPSFSPNAWQMSFGERAAIEGVLAQLQPRLAIEIGTAEGGSLERIAARSDHVISFDLVEPEDHARALANVTLRTGDSHDLLPRELQRLAAAGETIDFALVDGDHSAEGVRSDVEDLLGSETLGNAVVLAHDSLNPEVRRGLEAVPYEAIDKVSFVDLDFVGGYVPAEPPMRGECWGGLALIVVDAGGSFGPAHEGRRPAMTPLSVLIWPNAEATREARPGESTGGEAEICAEAERYRSLVEEMRGSLSWRLTAPLRRVMAWLRGRRRAS